MGADNRRESRLRVDEAGEVRSPPGPRASMAPRTRAESGQLCEAWKSMGGVVGEALRVWV